MFVPSSNPQALRIFLLDSAFAVVIGSMYREVKKSRWSGETDTANREFGAEFNSKAGVCRELCSGTCFVYTRSRAKKAFMRKA